MRRRVSMKLAVELVAIMCAAIAAYALLGSALAEAVSRVLFG